MNEHLMRLFRLELDVMDRRDDPPVMRHSAEEDQRFLLEHMSLSDLETAAQMAENVAAKARARLKEIL